MKTIILFFMFILVAPLSYASSTLVIIGYLDFDHDVNISGSHKVDFSMANRLEMAIDQKLKEFGYEQEKTELKNEFVKGQSTYHVINVNVLCPKTDRYIFSEDAIARKSTQLCNEQVKLSRHAISVLNTELKSYDRFIYIGHSRKGSGLGLGPYVKGFTFPINNTQESVHPTEAWVGGSLKSISFVSCDSNKYYGDTLRSLGFNFEGSDGDVYLRSSKSLPSAQNNLLDIISNFEK